MVEVLMLPMAFLACGVAFAIGAVFNAYVTHSKVLKMYDATMHRVAANLASDQYAERVSVVLVDCPASATFAHEFAVVMGERRCDHCRCKESARVPGAVMLNRYKRPPATPRTGQMRSPDSRAGRGA